VNFISFNRDDVEEQRGETPMYEYRNYFVYILASQRNGTLYIGVTNDLARRMYEHKHDLLKGFTQRYRVHSLVYYEVHGNILYAIEREKQLKWWRRQWKLELIEQCNPEWIDLVDSEGCIMSMPKEMSFRPNAVRAGNQN
jgi:putative endonuclease